jgi:TolA-binding protein
MTRRPADRVSLGVQALRRLTAEDGPVATITRARVLEREQGRGRRRLPVFALCVAAPLVISGALAAAMLVRRAPVPAPAVPAVAPAPRPHGVPPPAATLPDISKAMPTAPPTADVDAELTAYGAAHAAHFGRKDPAQAVRLWTAYLQRYPKGRFVPEAAYNRALTLVRLGRDEQAVAALKPIAAGRFGDYRREEAEALLGALTARAK